MFKGTIVALATPFDERGEVDWEKLVELIEWQIHSSIDGIVLCGTTGEAPTLSEEEQVKIFQIGVLTAKGRVPIIAGTGSYCTRSTLELTKRAKEAGVDGALVVLPYYNRPTAEGCLEHFKEISKAELPLIVYQHPGRTGVKLSVQALARIAELPLVVGIKEASCDLDYAVDLMQLTEKAIFSGDDTLTLALMAVGAVGVISIVANLIPREWKLLTTLLLLDQYEEGRELFYRYYPLAKAMVLETNPQCVKFALQAMGKCSHRLRLPLVEPQKATQEKILAALEKVQNYHLMSAR